MNTPLLLIILDGWGHTEAKDANAIALASTPTWNQLWTQYPHALIAGSGLAVGLPNGQMGNSEVGHMTMGTGRIIYQDLTLINNAIADQTFFSNPVLQSAIAQDNTLHILGLLSPGGVHSHEDHIFALLKMCGHKPVVVHPFLDGRDTPPQSARASLKKIQAIVAKHPNVKIADVMGRFYAMDRDKRMERTNAACDLLVKGMAPFSAPDVLTALDMAYARGENDEFVQPTKIADYPIRNGDTVICMNFRTDRARQICHALLANVKINLITLTEYDPSLNAEIVFPKQPVTNILSEIIAEHGLKQLHIAETEKYAHVTFFFNAGREQPFVGEDRVLIPSPKVETYDLCPEMSAPQITEAVVQAIKDKKYAVIICNFANADMVGHTGNLQATIKAVEVLDQCLGKIVAAIKEFGGQALITADHGNAEVMWDASTQQAHTAHTSNLVPLIYVGPPGVKFKEGNYGLQDVAPTMLGLLNIDKPKEMTGTSIVINS